MRDRRRVLVTGATGTHGGSGAHLVRLLQQSGIAVRALVRAEDDRAARLKAAGAEIVVGDFMKLSSLRPAMAGIERAFFCFPLADGLLQATTNFAAAAREAGVASVVNITIMMAREDHPSPVCRDHWLSERILDWAEIGAIHLRGGFFLENLIRFAADGVAREDAIVLPFGDGQAKLAWVSGHDMAAVAARLLADPSGHIGKTYEVTGLSPLSIVEIADIMSGALGRRIVYSGLDLPAWLARSSVAIGDNDQLRRHISVLSSAFSSGQTIGRTSDTVQNLAGHPPEDVAQFITDHASLFRPQQAGSQ